LVIIFQENISFDHYFGAYPFAMNPEGQPAFYAYSNTSSVNGFSPAFLSNNANASNTANGSGALAPFRLDRSQAATTDQDHDYTAEQTAYHSGLVDLFPMATGTAGPPPGTDPEAATTGLVMGYYDGNTVTALWNYAMSDNSYGTTYGPSTVGAINLFSGQIQRSDQQYQWDGRLNDPNVSLPAWPPATEDAAIISKVDARSSKSFVGGP
jgi:phospholipase C